VFQASGQDSLLDPVELFLCDEQCVVLGLDLEVRLSELNQPALTELH
jgi:hypothetical protein